MTAGIIAALLAGAAASGATATDAPADIGAAPGQSHSVRIDHQRGAIEAQYRSRVRIAHQQVGAVTPGGVPSTLRCAWRANVTVDRDARQAGGTTLARTMTREAALTGSRPGWCDGAKAGIAREVAGRASAIRDHMLAMAEEDRAVLSAEIDRLHGSADRG